VRRVSATDRAHTVSRTATISSCPTGMGPSSVQDTYVLVSPHTPHPPDPHKLTHTRTQTFYVVYTPLSPFPFPILLRCLPPPSSPLEQQTVHENRIYSLKIHCGDTYPDLPPTIQFISRVNLPFVSQIDGKVDPSKLPVLSNWNRNKSIETILVEIRRSVPTSFSLLTLLII
jgi:Ubiquitin-conjugating enzyme